MTSLPRYFLFALVVLAPACGDGTPAHDAAPGAEPLPNIDVGSDGAPPDTRGDIASPDLARDDVARPDLPRDRLDGDVQLDGPADADAAVDSASPDTTVDSASPDATVDSPSPDTTLDSVSPDATVDSVSPDATVDSVSPDATVDSATTPSVTGLYGTGNLLWNDYVRNDGATRFSASGTPCTGAEAGPYSACLHAGEMLALVVPNRTSCAGLSATDTLGAFNWTCVVDGGAVKIVSTGLLADKRLADLIDSATPSWKSNSLVVKDGGTVLLSSAPAPWHTNPLSTVTAGSGASALNSASTIYVVNSDITESVNITASHVGLVVAPGKTMTRDGVALGSVTAQAGTRFLWVEGSLSGPSRNVYWDGVRFSVLRHVSAEVGKVELVDASSNRIASLYVTRSSDAITLDSTSTLNVLEHVSVFGSSPSGVRVYGSNNVLADVTVGNSRVGIYFQGKAVSGLPPAPSNVLIGATSAANLSQGLWLEDAPDSTVMNVATVDTIMGVQLKDTTTAQLHNVAAANTFINDTPTYGTGIQRLGGATGTWTGLLMVGGNAVDCRDGASSISCTDASYGTSGATFSSGISLASAFVARVTADDPVNTSDSLGAAAFAVSLDWTRFASARRGWGKDGTFPSAAVKDYCNSGTCRIYDWSAKASDTVARAVLAVPTGSAAKTLTHTWAAADATACAAIAGASWNGSCTSTLLVNAVELTADGVGNDNLLCEAGERCLYTPNIGAYQGHGALVYVGLGGPASDIELYERQTNGR